ncbi:hypothetical protein [Saccharibacillus brassicae]|uniref:Uncharacterized protein n=1 Tax=Saccharibacillus brassicae TaxID=2583377 RepID=A0A4Y6V2D7_SACBS|nr:hypothetical protein [Saccharibacillus brassicae]QDH22647.1 hypothetical protein FFV09_18435 [Saccharibacillus brassicae]
MQIVAGDHTEFDIRCMVILGAYMKHWGMPEWRKKLWAVDKSDKSSFTIFLLPRLIFRLALPR